MTFTNSFKEAHVPKQRLTCMTARDNSTTQLNNIMEHYCPNKLQFYRIELSRTCKMVSLVIVVLFSRNMQHRGL